MNFFTGVVLCFGLIIAFFMNAHVIVNHIESKRALEKSVAFEAEQHESTIKACADGRTTYIRYNGVNCKKI